MSKDLWLADYEAVYDHFVDDTEKLGTEWATENAKAHLRKLGFDPGEIEDQLEGLLA
jgi:hypothetical protein